MRPKMNRSIFGCFPHARHAHHPRVAGRRTMHLTIGLHTVKMNRSNSGSIWLNNELNNGFSVGRTNARRVLGLGCKNTRETNMLPASSSIISAIPKWFWMVVSTCAN